MGLKLTNFLASLRSSLWFIPLLMMLISICAAFGMLALDEHVNTNDMKLSLLFYTGGSANAREVLSTIAGSMITVAGVVFSVTVVALSLSSTQFGPRLLRTFMKDRGTQLSLGSFVATYIYCLVVLRNVISTNDQDFIPNLSIALAIVLTLANLMVLIYFIHNVSISIQADHVIERVNTELVHGMEKLFPEEIGTDTGNTTYERPEKTHYEHSIQLRHPAAGYVQALDTEALWKLACRNDLLLEIHRIPGDHLVFDESVMTVHSSRKVAKDVIDELLDAYILGYQRTSEQDLGATIDQLVEIALRAISPSLNDPFTAMSCIDRLCSAFCRLAGRQFPSPYRMDDNGKVRMVTQVTTTFKSMFEVAFSPIAVKAVEEFHVLEHMIKAMNKLLTFARNDDQRSVITRQRTELEQMLKALSSEKYHAILRTPDPSAKA